MQKKVVRIKYFKFLKKTRQGRINPFTLFASYSLRFCHKIFIVTNSFVNLPVPIVIKIIVKNTSIKHENKYKIGNNTYIQTKTNTTLCT